MKEADRDAMPEPAFQHSPAGTRGVPGHRSPRTLRVILGYLFALAGLAWVFHDLSWSELRPVLQRISWPWVAAAIASDIASYGFQGLRWSLLLEPLGRLSPLRATQAIYAGLFVNELLPMRVGEFLRAWLASRRLGVPPAAVFPSIAVERLFDGLWLGGAVGLAAALVPLPSSLLRVGDLIGIVVAVALVVFLVLVLRTRSRPAGEGGRLQRFLAGQGAGIRAIGRSPRIFVGALASAAVLLLQAAAYWLVVRACGIDLAPGPGFVAFLVVHAGTAIPNAPGNVGAYQLFTVLGLTLFGVAKAEAAAFSVAVFVLLTVPLWVLGWLALSRSGLNLRAARELLHGSPREGGLP
jgi:glycosyltransferase 2 family protein